MLGGFPLRILFLGDVFAKTGRRAVTRRLSALTERYEVDFVIANGENATHGRGLSPSDARELYDAGVDFITLGNHTWSNNGIFDIIEDAPMVRPANFTSALPGKGYAAVQTPKGTVGILNLQGRVYMEPCDNPFEKAAACIRALQEETNLIIVDFHAEATSEKIALACYLDGQVTAVLGTHTHVQTADEHILPGGTAFISDAGMCGPVNSIIGMDTSLVMNRFVYSMPHRFEPAKGEAQINGVLIDADPVTGTATGITRIFERL